MALTAGCLLLGLGGAARAELNRFAGPHPVAPVLVRGMCRIEGPHVHSYEPHKRVLYVRRGGEWAFIGDPVEFDADIPKYGYYGHHPTFWADPGDDVVDDRARANFYCYIGGPHHHWYAPPPALSFKIKGGVFWYVGTPPPYYRQRWRRHSPIDDHYRTTVVVRPLVIVPPPEGFVGIYFGAHGGRGHGHGHVVAPGSPRVNIEVLVPGIGVTFGGVGRHGHGRHSGHAPGWGGGGRHDGEHGHGKGGHGKGGHGKGHGKGHK